MEFVSVRELRSKSSEIWQRLASTGELVITSNGKPIALLTPLDEHRFDAEVAAVRRARAISALNEVHKKTAGEGTNRLTNAEIEEEIKAVRKARAEE